MLNNHIHTGVPFLWFTVFQCEIFKGICGRSKCLTIKYLGDHSIGETLIGGYLYVITESRNRWFLLLKLQYNAVIISYSAVIYFLSLSRFTTEISFYSLALNELAE